MAVKLMNYNILENIFTVIKKLSLLTVPCLAVLALSSPALIMAAPKKPAAAETKSVTEIKPVAEQDKAKQPDNTAKELNSTAENAPKANNEKPETDSSKQGGGAAKSTEASKESASDKPVVTSAAVVKGNPQAGNALTTTCATCHGADGNSPLPIYPKLAGQHESYLLKMLLAYQALKDPASEAATHKSTNAQIMYTQIMNFSEQELADLAAFFSIQKPTNGETNPASYELGRKLYLGGDLERGIPACAACHSPAGLGNDLADFPKLSGQHSEYIKSQLLAFKNDERINDMMQIVAKKLTEEEMAAVSSYASGVH